MGGSQYRFPNLSATEEDIKEFQRRYFARWNTYRTRHMERINRSLYYVLGRQWVERDRDIYVEGARGFALRDMAPHDQVEMPMPVTNLIAPAIDTEFATLSKRQWLPKIPTYSRDPRMEAAAKVADDVLNDRLRKLDWETLRDRFILNLITMGTALFHSFWEESYYETSWVSVPDPVVCTQCGKLLADSEVPIGSIPGSPLAGSPEGATPLPVGSCPFCGGQLQPAFISEMDSRGKDAVGRSLGFDVPKGGTALELVTPFEYYPQNAGVGITPDTSRQHGIAKVRSLDWVEEHHPDVIDQVEPEEQEELMRNHPLLGEWDILGRLSSPLDTGIYDHHVMVYDLFAHPSYRYPDGRAIRVIGSRQQLVVRNEALVRRVSGAGGEAGVPISCVAGAVWKPREGEYWGKTLADDLISPQNRINGMDAQTIEARERMGSPNLMVPADSNLEGPEYRDGFGLGKVFKYEVSALNPQAKPEVFGAITMPQGVQLERQSCIDAMTRIIGPADIEIGEAPRNITTTSGLQILGEQAERRRATRERGITSAFKRVWEHQLQLLWTLRVDADTYEAKLPDGSWEIRQYVGESIGGQTKVEIERQAYIDRSILIREATRQALVDHLYDPSTPMARKKLLELMGLPTDVNEDTNLQIEHARRIWVDFVDHSQVPVIDPSIDNPSLRFQVLGVMLLQDEGQRISSSSLWPDILPILAGWEEEYQRMATMDSQVRQQYGGEPSPQVASETYAKLELSWQKAQDAWDQQKAAVTQDPMAGMTSPLGPPPERPLPPMFLPQQPEKRVYAVWQSIFQRKLGPQGLQSLILQKATAVMIDPQTLASHVDLYLRFRAVVEAYRLMAPPMQTPGSGPGSAGPNGIPVGSPGPPGMQQPGPPPTPATPPQPPTPVGV